MALLADRVKETTTTTGTGTVSLAGAPAGFQSFNTAFANGSLVYYVIQGGAEWEIGIGTTGTGTLARTQVLQSSNADALVPFSAGVKDVFCSYVADRAVTTVDAATLTNKTLDDYTNNIGANSTHFRIKATGTISKGTVVKATGYNPGENAIEVAVVTSATDLVLGISEQALTAGQFGLAVVIGELFDVNTNGFTVGNIIYSNGSGGFTETKPSSGLYQALGWIVRANASNGVIAVNVVAPLYVETSTNTANTSVLRDGSGNFAAGTITATLSGTATQVSNALTAGTYLTSGGTYNGSAARTFAVDATDANTASKVVARDASGNFSAGTITATLNGAAPAGSLSGNTLASGVTASSLTSVGTLSSLTVSGNVTLSSTGQRFIADMSNATVANRFAFQNSTVNAQSIINVLPNGTGTVSQVQLFNNSDPTNAAYAGLFIGTSEARLQAGIQGTGTYLPLTFYTNGSERVRLDTSGNLAVDTNTLYVDATNNAVGIGTSSPNAFGTFTVFSSGIGGHFNSTSGAAGINLYEANTGRFSLRTLNGSNGLSFFDSNASVERARIDASGNLGLGVTPSAWSGVGQVLQVGQSAAVIGNTAGSASFLMNAYYDGSTYRYINTAAASRLSMTGGSFGFQQAASGTAGAAISFTAAMTLTASGNLTIGGTNESARLRVEGTTDLTTGLQLFRSGVACANIWCNGALVFGLDGSAGTTERARIDASGNLGLGVTPSAWGSGFPALQIGNYGAFLMGRNSNNQVFLGVNAYYNGTNWIYSNTAPVSRYYQSVGAHYWETAPSGTAGNAITFTQAMTLNANGNLSVGTTNSSSPITVKADAGDSVSLRVLRNASGAGTIQITDDPVTVANMAMAYNHSTTYGSLTSSAILGFGAGGSERARITSGGYFKASNDGTYFSSTGSLHEFRSSTNDTQTLFVHNTSATLAAGGSRGILINYTATPNATDRGFLACFDGNLTTERATIRSNGGLANYQSNNVDLSDIRTKTDIAPAASMWSKIGALEIVTYKYTDQTHDDVNVGVIAQQVEAVEPVWVDADGFGETPADGVPLKTVYTKDITFAAIKALQEAMARIETLEQRVLALEA